MIALNVIFFGLAFETMGYGVMVQRNEIVYQLYWEKMTTAEDILKMSCAKQNLYQGSADLFGYANKKRC